LRRESLYLQDIADACRRIAGYVSDVEFERFAGDAMLFDAIVRNLQNIGEAVRMLPEEVRSLAPETDWSRIVGLRNILVHHYFGVDEEIVWDLATVHAPALETTVSEILDRLSEND